MTVSLSKSTDFIPSDGVRVVSGGEQGYEGYVSRSVPTNGDDLYVNITSINGVKVERPHRLSYKASSLVRTRRNGKK